MREFIKKSTAHKLKPFHISKKPIVKRLYANRQAFDEAQQKIGGIKSLRFQPRTGGEELDDFNTSYEGGQTDDSEDEMEEEEQKDESYHRS